MIHHGQILQPEIVKRQQLIVVLMRRSITTMSGTEEKMAFALRINLVADRLGIPPKGKNRQKIFGEMFGVSQEAARKWLEGEAIPQMVKCIEMAKRGEVGIEWLMTGRGCDAYADTPEARVYIAMQKMTNQEKYQMVKIGNSLAEPDTDGGNGGSGDNPAQPTAAAQ